MHFRPITSLTEQQWRDFFELSREIRWVYRPDVPIASRDVAEFRQRHEAMGKRWNLSSYVAYPDAEAEKPVGFLSHYFLDGEIQFSFDEMADEFSDALLQQIAHKIADAIAAHNARQGACGAQDPRAVRALQRLSPSHLDLCHVMELRRDTAPMATIEAWAANVPEDMTFKIYYDYPEELLADYIALNEVLAEDYARLGSESLARVWTLDSLRKYRAHLTETHSAIHTLVAYNADGSVAGLTDTHIRHAEPPRFMRSLSVVHPRQRGQGIAKALKARSFLDLCATYREFERITTAILPNNVPIRRLNDQMGYTFLHELCEAGLTREDLLKWLEQYKNV